MPTNTRDMSSLLVTYGTGHGQTARVAERIASVLDDHGHDVTALPVSDASAANVRAADAVLVGSPVQNRRYLPEVVEFVRANSQALAAVPTGFFQLSLAVLFPFRWARNGDHRWIDTLVEETGWQPDRVGRFAGAIAYTQYDRPTRWAFRFVSLLTTGDTDASRDYEYTDWAAVEQFAEEFSEYVDREVTDRRDRPGLRTAALGALGVGIGAVAYWVATRGPLGNGTDVDGDGFNDQAAEPVSA